MGKKSDNSKSLPMVSGDKICQFKKTRGLGLKKMEAVNNAFFLEQINLEVVP